MSDNKELYERYKNLPTSELEDILYDIEMSAALTLGMNTYTEQQHKQVLRQILKERGVDVQRLFES
jgi:flavorubredoxin